MLPWRLADLENATAVPSLAQQQVKADFFDGRTKEQLDAPGSTPTKEHLR